MRSNLIRYYLLESKAPLEQLALYIHLDQPFLFPDPKKVLKELQSESSAEESTEEKKESKQSQNRGADSYAAASEARRSG
jgi:hypothetical protein